MSNYIKRTLVLKSTNQTDQTAILQIMQTTSGSALSLRGEVLLEQESECAVFDGTDVFVTTQAECFCPLAFERRACCGIFICGKIAFFATTDHALTPSVLQTAYDQQTQLKTEITQHKFDANLYNDEQICTYNYYDNRLIGEVLTDEQQQLDCNAETETQLETKQEKTESATVPPKNDAFENACKRKETDFYKRVENDLKRAFEVGQREYALESAVPFSKWATLRLDEKNCYAFGIIYNGEIPRFLCYGVPGVYGNPPTALKKASFIPKNLFRLDGEGYYVLFQSAETGESVNVNLDAFGI